MLMITNVQHRDPYDVARELTSILGRITEKPLILLFDAWEQSASVENDRKILVAFLSHPDDWPRCHIILGLRHPELRRADPADHGCEAAKHLCSSAPGTAELYELPPMHLESALEQHNLTAFVRTRIPPARQTADANLLSMVQGFPGVLDFWAQSAAQIWNDTDMQRYAEDAQACRYREFDSLLPNLQPQERTLATRLALAPRLDTTTWPVLQHVFLHDLPPHLLGTLSLKGVLLGEETPDYGHETRHFAARRWFLRHTKHEALAEINAILPPPRGERALRPRGRSPVHCHNSGDE